jgi:phage terminase Nu1 subunit (DNA packaging protein)
MSSYLKGNISSGYDYTKQMVQKSILTAYITQPIIKSLKEKKDFPTINYDGIIKELRPEIDLLIKTLEQIVQDFTIPPEEFNEILKKEGLQEVDPNKQENKQENKQDLINNLKHYKQILANKLKTLFEKAVIVQKGLFSTNLSIIQAYNAVKKKNEGVGIKVEEINKNINDYEKELENIIATKVADVNNILDIVDLVTYVKNPVIYDAQEKIKDQARRQRNSQNEAMSNDMNGINISLCSSHESTFECIRDFFGFSQANFNKLKQKIKDEGVFTTVFDFLLSSIRIAIINDLLKRTNQSISNITLNYKLNEQEIKALKSFSDIFIDIVKGFISVDFFKMLFESALDEYKNYKKTHRGGTKEQEEQEETKVTEEEPQVTEPQVTEPQVTKEETKVTEEEPQQQEPKKVKKDCDCNKIGQMNNVFNKILTNIANKLIKVPIKNHLTDYNTAMKNIQKNLPNLFPDFLQDMFGYMMLTLPINIVIFITSLIPSPLPSLMIQSLLNHANKSVNNVLQLLMIAASPMETTSSETTSSDSLIGGKKSRRKRQHTRKYYLNRINTTIRKFYKTNRTRFKRKYL